MSYGRAPYLIIGTGRGVNFIEPAGWIADGVFPYEPVGDAMVSYEAVAQFLVHLAIRGTDELQSWIDLGAGLDRDCRGFYRDHPDEGVRKSEEAYTKRLKSIRVTVTMDPEEDEE